LAVVRNLLDVVPDAEIECGIELNDEQAIVRLLAGGTPLSRSVDIDAVREFLMLACGGSIAATHSGRGVSATISLPVLKARAERLVVLAVDDNADLMTLFGTYCEGTPYELVHIRESSEALDAVEEYRPDVILLDVILPDADGWELLRALRASPLCVKTPIIVCSVMADDEVALALGAASCLRKPVWRRQLLAAFDNVLNRAPT
jgi:CheY-like chemotaxis protein